jgi:hypothetical protein
LQRREEERSAPSLAATQGDEALVDNLLSQDAPIDADLGNGAKGASLAARNGHKALAAPEEGTRAD